MMRMRKKMERRTKGVRRRETTIDKKYRASIILYHRLTEVSLTVELV